MASKGTNDNPAIARVRTKERAHALLEFCDANGIVAIVGVEPDSTEDITDIEAAVLARQPVVPTLKIGRNDPCPCGSGKKFKKCCEGRQPGARG